DGIRDLHVTGVQTCALPIFSPEMQRRQQVAFEGANANNSVLGVWPAYFEIQNHALARGRLFSVGDERGRRRVAGLGARVGERLNVPTEALLGRTIRLRRIPFGLFGNERVSSILVQATSEDAMDAAVAEIDAKLRRAHRIQPGEPSDFTVRNQTTLLSTLSEATKTFTMLLAGIAAISLLVGGIGIMT